MLDDGPYMHKKCSLIEITFYFKVQRGIYTGLCSMSITLFVFFNYYMRSQDIMKIPRQFVTVLS